MRTLSRRRFLGGAAAAGGMAAVSPGAFAKACLGRADVILSGGTFYTMDAIKHIGIVRTILGGKTMFEA